MGSPCNKPQVIDMKSFMPLLTAAALLSSTAAIAQTTAPAPTTSPGTSPITTQSVPSSTTTAAPSLTDEQAQTWVDKSIYSSDGKTVGEVAAFKRDASGKVLEMHADIGGFLGIGETRVLVAPTQFQLSQDRVVLNMTAEQAKTLPKIAK